jgi:predicted O-methyltransferase YrrM
MDAKIQAVLDAYHERMAAESARGWAPGANVGREWVDQVLLAVGPETGELLHILAGALDKPNILELGTSYGYSTIWLGAAAKAAGGSVTTIELADYKSAYAAEMADKAGLAGHIHFLVGDALALIETLPHGIDLVLLDLWKDMYVPCLDAFFAKLNPGAIIVADNMLRPGGEAVQAYGRAVRAKPGMTSVLLPVGSGIEISRLER